MAALRLSLRLICLLAWFLIQAFVTSPLYRAWRRRGGKADESARVLQNQLRIACRILGLRIHSFGVRPSHGAEAFLLVANHISYLDIFVLGSQFPVSFMAKQEISRWPVLGALGRWADSIFVDRRQVETRLKALHALRRKLKNRSVCVFPEGTTTAELRPSRDLWQRGTAAMLKSPAVSCYAAALHYAQQSEAAWINDDALVPHLLRILMRRQTDVFVATDRLPSYQAGERLGYHAQLALDTCSELAARAEQALPQEWAPTADLCSLTAENLPWPEHA